MLKDETLLLLLSNEMVSLVLNLVIKLGFNGIPITG